MYGQGKNLERGKCTIRVTFPSLPVSHTYVRTQQELVGQQFPQPSDKPLSARENLRKVDSPDSESAGQRDEQWVEDRIHRTDANALSQ